MTMDEFKAHCDSYLKATLNKDRHEARRIADEYRAKLDRDWGFLFYMISRWEYDVENWLKGE